MLPRLKVIVIYSDVPSVALWCWNGAVKAHGASSHLCSACFSRSFLTHATFFLVLSYCVNNLLSLVTSWEKSQMQLWYCIAAAQGYLRCRLFRYWYSFLSGQELRYLFHGREILFKARNFGFKKTKVVIWHKVLIHYKPIYSPGFRRQNFVLEDKLLSAWFYHGSGVTFPPIAKTGTCFLPVCSCPIQIKYTLPEDTAEWSSCSKECETMAW